jgi:hypothetical protein
MFLVLYLHDPFYAPLAIISSRYIGESKFGLPVVGGKKLLGVIAFPFQ